MEPRKLIKFGGSSHVVSIPNLWIKRNALNKGDYVYVEERIDELVISAKESKAKLGPKEININTDVKDIKTIESKIISSYINNYDQINLKGENISQIADKIREFLHKLVALEIIEQTSNLIVAKDYLDIGSVSVNTLIRKIDIILKSMVDDVKTCVHHRSKISKEHIFQREQDVNRLTFLAFKVIKRALDDVHIAKNFEMNQIQLLYSWNLIGYMEDVADQIKRICRYLHNMNDKIDSKNFIKIYEVLQKQYDNTLKAYYTNDKELALNILSQEVRIIKDCDNYLGKNNSIMVAKLMEKLKTMSVSDCNISKMIIDM